MPLFYPRGWLWLDFAPARKEFRLKVLRHFGEPMTFKRIARDANGEPIELPVPFVAREGAMLDLEPWRGKLSPEPPRAPILGHRAFAWQREGLSSLSWSAIGSDTNTAFHATDAFDGYEETRWESSGPVSGSLWWRLDMGRPQSFKSVKALSSPVGVAVECSHDAQQWQPLKAGESNQARYLRLKPVVEMTSTNDPWRLFEVSVLP